jgi:Pectinacetylesterase
MRLPRLLPLALLLAAFACGDGEEELPPLTWTWVPIEGAVCSDGSQTGIGIERGAGASPNVLVFLDGGGACWEYLTCFGLPRFGVPTVAPGPFGAEELEARIRDRRAGSVLDRAAPGNPYKDFTFVFVPYCTGDVHAGDRSQDYVGAPRRWHHKGRVNLSKAFEYLPTVLDAPSKVVVSGASAGGFGSLIAFDMAKGAWPTAKAYLVDDSGPPLPNIPDLTLLAWDAAWDLGTAVEAVCGAPCASSLAPLILALAAKHPTDRFALLSSTRDDVIRGFFADPLALAVMPEATFEAGLRELASAIEDDTPDAPPGETHAFIVTGRTHPMLDRPGSFSSEGVTLFEWLRRQVEDEPGWARAIPPEIVAGAPSP